MKYVLSFGLKNNDELNLLRNDPRIKPTLDAVDKYIAEFINKRD
jgi:hypothetical protein